MATNSAPADATKVKPRRWIQFSVRTVVLVTMLLGIGLGLVTNRARRQREAVRAIEGVGGSFFYDYQKASAKRPNVFQPKAPAPGPEWLRRLIGPEYFHDVVMVNLREKAITDEHLKELRKLPKLENLNLIHTQITSKGSVHLAELRNLKYLALSNTQFDDSGLERLAHLDKMYALLLDGTNVTDAGLKHLEGMTNLEEWLGLSDTKVSDAGLRHLKRLTKLRQLTLRRTNVTADGVKELQRSLPGTQISYGL